MTTDGQGGVWGTSFRLRMIVIVYGEIHIETSIMFRATY
jgi:hypothetical protein